MSTTAGDRVTTDRREASPLARLLRGEMRPQASVYPAAMRATRALLRRRMPLMRKRAAWLPQFHKMHRQDNRPESGPNIASKANRPGVAAQQRSAGALALLDHDDPRRRGLARAIRKTAKPPDTNTRYRLRTVPGIGERLSLRLRDAIHDTQRVPRVQAYVSSGR